MTKKKKNIVLILHNVRSANNVGSIFRTADAAGVGKIYLSGHTATPVDRFGRKRRDVAKTALGAEVGLREDRDDETRLTAGTVIRASSRSISTGSQRGRRPI